MNLTNNAKFYKVYLDTTGTAVSTDGQGAIVLDMQGYDGVLWMADLEGVTSTEGVNIFHMHSDSTSTTDMVSCSGAGKFASSTAPAADKMLLLDVQKPLKRYVSCYVERISAGTVGSRVSVYGIQYKNHDGPITQSTGTYGVLDTAVVVSPTT